MQLHNHIKALEGADTPSKALDGNTIDLLGLAPPGFKRASGGEHNLWIDGTGAARMQTWTAPELTKSMDEAARLINPNWRIRSMSDANETTRARVILERVDPEPTAFAPKRQLPTVVGYGCNRATAILAAAMRSRAYDRGSPTPASREFVREQIGSIDHKLQIA